MNNSNLFERRHLIMTGKLCPYCEKSPEFVNSSEIFERSSGMIYLCRNCKAWVGVHEGTTVALGRLADEELREWKRTAHYWLDLMFTENLINKVYPEFIHGISNRQKTYLWLAEKMGIQQDFCHIGMFDLNECKQTVEICKTAIATLFKDYPYTNSGGSL